MLFIGKAELFFSVAILLPQQQKAGTITYWSFAAAPLEPWTVNYRQYKIANSSAFKGTPNFVESPSDLSNSVPERPWKSVICAP